ncbi:MAG: helicase, partial [Bacteroidaceae bacterium]|nr:helicase [Bacteroidaceae bacterium]
MMKFFKKWWDKKRPQCTQTANVQTHETFVRNHTKLPRKTKANQLSTLLETFLTEHYTFRYNVLTEQAEVRALGEKKFRPVTQRVANTLCLEAQEQGIPCWDKDVLRLLNSERLTDYHPLLTYMAELPVWDGIDRITPLAERISTEEIWVNGFHRWMLGVAAQWSGQMDRCANALAPMLISTRQGMGKSTFCRQLVPESLTNYYTDSFDLTAQTSCEQKLSLFG